MNNLIEIGHGISLNFTTKDGSTVPSDVWVFFKGEDGKSACISIAAYAEKSGSVIGAGLRSWASDRINKYTAQKIFEEEAAAERAANGQFGVGA